MSIAKFIRWLLSFQGLLTISSSQVTFSGGATLATRKQVAVDLTPAGDDPQEFTIAHGLSNEPSIVQVWNNATTYRSLINCPIRKDGTNIYITLSQAIKAQIEIIGY